MVTVVHGKVCAKNHPDRLSRLATIHQRYRRTDGRISYGIGLDLTVGQKQSKDSQNSKNNHQCINHHRSTQSPPNTQSPRPPNTQSRANAATLRDLHHTCLGSGHSLSPVGRANSVSTWTSMRLAPVRCRMLLHSLLLTDRCLQLV